MDIVIKSANKKSNSEVTITFGVTDLAVGTTAINWYLGNSYVSTSPTYTCSISDSSSVSIKAACKKGQTTLDKVGPVSFGVELFTCWYGVNKESSNERFCILRDNVYGDLRTDNGTISGLPNFTATSITTDRPQRSWSPRGWQDSEEINTFAIYNAGTTPKLALSSTYSFYALYSNAVTISYNANGGTGSMSDSSETAYYNTSGKFTTPFIRLASNSFSPPKGRQFNGWIKSDGTSFSSDALGQYIRTNYDNTAYASWKGIRKITLKGDSRKNTYNTVKFQANIYISSLEYNGTYKVYYTTASDPNTFLPVSKLTPLDSSAPQVTNNNTISCWRDIFDFNYKVDISGLPPDTQETYYLILVNANNTKILESKSNGHLSKTLKDPRSISLAHNKEANTPDTIYFDAKINLGGLEGTYSIYYSFYDEKDTQGDPIWHLASSEQWYNKSSQDIIIHITITELHQNTTYYPILALKHKAEGFVAYDLNVNKKFETITAKAPRYIELFHNNHKNGCHSLYLNATISVDALHGGWYWVQYATTIPPWNQEIWKDVYSVGNYRQRDTLKIAADATLKDIQIVIKDFDTIDPGGTYTPKVRLIVPAEKNPESDVDISVASDERLKISTTAANSPTSFSGFRMKQGSPAGKVKSTGEYTYEAVYLTVTEWESYLNKVAEFVKYHNDFNESNITFNKNTYMVNVAPGQVIKKDLFVNLCNNILEKMPNHYGATLPDFNSAPCLQAALFHSLRDYLNKTIRKTG